MTVTPLPQSGHRAPPRTLSQRLVHALAYLTAAALGLSVGPALLLLTDRATFLHWTNLILDIVSGR